MTIRDVLNVYGDYLQGLGIRAQRYPRRFQLRMPIQAEKPPGSLAYMAHALYLITTLPLDVSDTEAARVLGFVQGVLWMCGAYSFEQLWAHLDLAAHA